MELGEATELVRVAFAPRGTPPPTRPALVAPLSAIARVRAVLDALEVEAARLLARMGADAETVVAEATRTGLRDASRVVERATALDSSPALSDALAGRVSGAHVDAFARTLRELPAGERPALAARGDFLRGVAERTTPGEFARTVKAEAARVTAASGEERLARQRRAASLRTWVDETTGMWNGRFQFDPATGVLLDARLNAAVARLFAERPPGDCPADPVARQQYLRALALRDMLLGRTEADDAAAGSSAPNGQRAAGSGVTVDVALVIDLDHVDGAGAACPRVDVGLPVDLPVSVIRQLCANAVINPIAIRNGLVVGGVGRLNLGRTSRLASRAQRRALRVMYPTCAFPGCEARFSLTKPHHVIWWRHGGVTDLDNLLPLCSKHHHHVHDDRWQVKLLPDRTLIVIAPDGTTMRTGPPRNRGS